MAHFGVKSLSVLVVVCLWLGPGLVSAFPPPMPKFKPIPGLPTKPWPDAPLTLLIEPSGEIHYNPPLFGRQRRSPQGSVQGSVIAPEHGRPSLSLDYNHRVLDNGRSTLDAHGGVSSPDFRHFQPHAGATYEYNPNKNFFIRGQGGVQGLPGGRFEPHVGAGLGWRF